MATKIWVTRKFGKLVPCEEIDKQAINALEEGKDYEVTVKAPRNIKFHRKYWALLGLTYENLPEGFVLRVNDQNLKIKNANHLHWLLKMEMGFYSWVTGIDGQVHAVVKSIAFNKMTEPEFQDFYSKAIDTIVTYFLQGANAEDLREEIEHSFA